MCVKVIIWNYNYENLLKLRLVGITYGITMQFIKRESSMWENYDYLKMLSGTLTDFCGKYIFSANLKDFFVRFTEIGVLKNLYILWKRSASTTQREVICQN